MTGRKKEWGQLVCFKAESVSGDWGEKWVLQPTMEEVESGGSNGGVTN